MLNIYSIKTNNPCAMLQPFFGAPSDDANDPDTGRYDEYQKNANLYFSMTDTNEAEAIIYPTDWNQMNGDIFQKLSKLASPSKPIIIFHNDDDANPIRIKNALVYRTSMIRSNGAPYEFGLPAWSKDLSPSLAIRRKSDKPSIGFCGQAQIPIRSNMLSKLSKCQSLTTDFIVRGTFWAGALGGGGFTNSAATRRAEFTNNILNNDFSLCPRGAGNFSYRLYETMSCGRIPVIPEASQVLPYENMIDWPSLALFVTLDNAESKILAEYNMLDNEGFEAKQREIRKVWETHLSTNGFFSKLEEHIRCQSGLLSQK